MKIIDLLVKIANGEEAPKKIKWQGQIYEYSRSNRFYYQNSWSMYRDFYTEGNCLNDEVEIIEEPKKIKKINRDRYNGTDIDPLDDIFDKLDELIDEINNLKEK